MLVPKAPARATPPTTTSRPSASCVATPGRSPTRAVDAGADLVLGSGPHVLRGIELDRGRLIAYSLGNLAGFHNFALGGRSALSGLLRVRVGPEGSFAAGTFASLRLTGPGLPQVDPTHAAAALVSTLSREDFGARGITVRADGTLAAP